MKKLLASLRPWAMKLLIIPPVIIGVLILGFALRNRLEPERVPEKELARVLRVISVERMEFVPRAVGYGTSQPAKTWQAISEVKGRVVELNPNLQSGSFIPAESLLVRLDDTDTKLSISKLNSEIAKANSSISELEATGKNLEASLKLEREALELAEKELRRMESLSANNAVSRSEVDTLKRNVIAQRQAVQSIVSSLNLLPSQVDSAKANLAASQATLAEKNRDLARLKITAPFDCRIGPVDLEMDQFVAAGETLFNAHATDAVEIEAQVSVRDLRKLFNESLRKQDLERGEPEFNQQSMKRYFDIEVVVRYESGGSRNERKATFERIREQLDAQTRTTGVVVSVAKPFQSTVGGPPPVSGTYCEVELRGKPQSDQVIIPRSAIHDEHVYLLNQDNRLCRQKLNVSMTQSEFAVIKQGLEPGQVLVVSDPTPAVEGMLVEPELDDELLQRLRAQASGEEKLR